MYIRNEDISPPGKKAQARSCSNDDVVLALVFLFLPSELDLELEDDDDDDDDDDDLKVKDEMILDIILEVGGGEVSSLLVS